MLPNIKTTRANKDIIDAANAWCKDSAAAEVKYGHISKRDTSPCDNYLKIRVTLMMTSVHGMSVVLLLLKGCYLDVRHLMAISLDGMSVT